VPSLSGCAQIEQAVLSWRKQPCALRTRAKSDFDQTYWATVELSAIVQHSRKSAIKRIGTSKVGWASSSLRSKKYPDVQCHQGLNANPAPCGILRYPVRRDKGT